MEPPRPFNTWISVRPDVVGPEVVRLVADFREGEGQPAAAPADRPVAEAAVSGLYDLVGAPQPRLVWIDSPRGEPDWDWSEFGAPDPEAIAATHGVPEPGEFLLLRLNGVEGEKGRFSHGRRRRVWERRLALWQDLVGSCGGWWPFEDVCLVCERPEQIHLAPEPRAGEEPLRLHRRTGPAIRYRDGFQLYALHGRVVPADAVDGERTGTARPPGLPENLAGLTEDGSAGDLARLAGKDFRGADLRGVRFPQGADLIDADLSGADLRRADLSWACPGPPALCMGVEFAGARLVGADLRGADFGIIGGFAGADLTDADLSGAALGGAPEVGASNFDGAKLVRTRLIGADLIGAVFTGADLTGADFTHARFAHMSGRPSPDHVLNLFARCTWDVSTRWPDGEWAEAVREVSGPIGQDAFQVREEGAAPVRRPSR
ncbi:pentapeptide repeat-containing protein [Actinomadura sp. 7K534]|uniref:pentapeptide repeat-containing protein n=1 Tax=Actinomadura sp. 7K534 TaxID=2530366 RepID=UPI00104CC284|nr:pentapeptide repeat-containing protein [Actinomadura sp. 7K534]TDB98223.1 pentapeptide repeat-containing protein [Actinomadura sp. 7K534]